MSATRKRVVFAASALAMAGGLFGAVGGAQASTSCTPVSGLGELCIQVFDPPHTGLLVSHASVPGSLAENAAGAGLVCNQYLDESPTLHLAAAVAVNGHVTQLVDSDTGLAC